jgi:tetratricopeptide (TPR) repeat protein
LFFTYQKDTLFFSNTQLLVITHATTAAVVAPTNLAAAKPLEVDQTVRALMYEAMLNVQDKQYEIAIPKLESVIKDDPTLLEAWSTLGWAYWALDRKQDAAELWQRLLNIAPNEPMGYNLMAQVAVYDGDLTRAEELFEKSLTLNPDQYEMRISLARVLLWNGKTEQAAKDLRRLLQEDRDRLDVEIDLAWAMYANEEYEDVLEVWNHINDVIPDQPGYMMARAQVLLLIGSLTEAEAEARRILEIDPGNRDAFNLLANLAMRARRPEEAIDALRIVYDMAKTDAVRAAVALQIASYMKSVYDTDKTVFTLSQCLDAAHDAYKLDEENISCKLFYGELLTSARHFDRAEDVFQSVIKENNPFNLRAHMGLVHILLASMQLDEAEKKINETFRLFNVANPYRHLLWARLHFARGNIPEAMDALDRLEREGAAGAVFTLLYHGISPSEWSDVPSVRQFREHLMVLRRAGFKFITPSQFNDYFAKHDKPPAVEEKRSLLSRALQGVRASWSGRRVEQAQRLSDYTPDMTVCVTMDDALRNSLRYGNVVAEELQVPITMFLPVGNILKHDTYTASFKEIRDYNASGLWEMQSHLMQASYLAMTNQNGREVNPLPNLVWLPEKNRQESLREYHARLRYEFRDSRRILARELGLGESEINAVAYPIGDIGQETTCNIDFFNVPEVILNEAEITYALGFIQDEFGYSMPSDNPMLYKRYEPKRFTTGREVYRAAMRNHPVFAARRMRAEIAALSGELHLAQEMVRLLKRDGYPEEDLEEINTMVHKHVARLMHVPETAPDDISIKKEVLFEPQKPFLAVEGDFTKANVMIESWHGGAAAGLNLNPRLSLNVRAGIGGIKQTVFSNTVVEVEQTSRSSSRSDVTIITDGETMHQTEYRTTVSTVMLQSNRVDEYKYKADEQMVGAALNYIHTHGAYTMLDLRYRSFTGDELDEDAGVLVGSLEHQWRPVPAFDTSVRYQHDLVPSARKLLEYNGFALRAIWRVKDWWHASTFGAFSVFDDDNSHLHANVENLWRMSTRHNVWLGLHDSVDTVDRDSDLYWTPYWDQRHYLVLRISQSYPNYTAAARFHLGLQKEKARQEDLDAYNTAKAAAEGKGWYPGSNPQQGWNSLLGLGVTLSRRWQSGWEFSGEFVVNAIRDYTEHTISGRLMYRF